MIELKIIKTLDHVVTFNFDKDDVVMDMVPNSELVFTLQVTPEKLKEHLDKNYSSETFKRQVMRVFEELKI